MIAFIDATMFPDAYSLIGRYQIDTKDEITLELYILDTEQEICAELRMTGALSNLDQFTGNVLNTVLPKIWDDFQQH